MGTDIHLMVEQFTDDGWRLLKPPGLYVTELYRGCSPLREYLWEFGRSYSTFAVLANVRNGFGFAGCDIGDGFVPIADHRGLPDDISDGARKAYSHGLLGDHSFTHLTLQELIDYPHWDDETRLRGFVDRYHYSCWRSMQRHDRYAQPHEWCGGVGGGTKILSNAEMDALIAKDTHVAAHRNRDEYWTQIEWPVTTRHCVKPLLELMATMLTLKIEPSLLRLVFGFDS